MWWTWVLGCRPPEAPEGLDASLLALLRDFHADDEVLSADLTGLMAWFDADGAEFLDAKADLDNVGAFQLGPLSRAETARLPVEGDPDPALAPGVVSVAEMACGWAEAEALLVRADQQVVFDTTWDDYARTYDTPRRDFEAARADGAAPIRDEIGDDALLDHPDTLLVTRNEARASQLTYHMTLDLEVRFRHGTFRIGGEDRDAFLVLGFMPHEGRTDDDTAGIAQSYSIDVDVSRPGGRTLRVFGAWSQLDSPLLPADSPFVLTSGVNESQDAAARMSAICGGEVDLPRE